MVRVSDIRQAWSAIFRSLIVGRRIAIVTVAAVALACLGAAPVWAVDAEKRIPAEYESTSALGVAMNNGGYAANDPHAAVRANPALLSLEKQYSVSAGYHWPQSGREFYQASV